MKLNLKKRTSGKVNSRLTKKVRIRKKISGSSERPRLCVFRSLKHTYGQIIDDTQGKVLLAFSSQSADESLSGKELARWVGKKIAEKAVSSKIEQVVFDRNGFVYHGRIKEFAEGAREGGLKF